MGGSWENLQTVRTSVGHEVIQIITDTSVSHLRHHLTPVWTISGKLESGCFVTRSDSMQMGQAVAGAEVMHLAEQLGLVSTESRRP